MKDAPKAGDIIHYDFTYDSEGREIRGRRPALVVSSQKFNELLKQAWICPISGGLADRARDAGYVVPLMGACRKTDGSVQIHQLRSIDLEKREFKIVDKIVDSKLLDFHNKIFSALGIDKDDLPS